jgi:hypothetical protein
MQAVLITLGVLGCGAMLISVYIFTAAARRFVHERVEYPQAGHTNPGGVEKLYDLRSGRERRRQSTSSFPLALPGGETVPTDRRRCERRRILN